MQQLIAEIGPVGLATKVPLLAGPSRDQRSARDARVGGASAASAHEFVHCVTKTPRHRVSDRQ
jgi:hypothetical protein